MNSNIIPQLHLGKGNVIISIGIKGDDYFMEFRAFSHGSVPGSDVSADELMESKPCFVIRFGALESLKVFTDTANKLLSYAMSEAVPHD